MGYLKIPNLYKDQTILLFKECYALEKIHGTSAHVKWADDTLYFFSGGEKYDNFRALFDASRLTEAFTALGHPEVTVYGEAYGGKCQGMKDTYGDKLKFVAFDVEIGGYWLDVPNAAEVAGKLGLEFVPYEQVSTNLEALEAQRDLPSRQAVRNGILEPKMAEGVVLRPLKELVLTGGDRVIVKFKRPEFSERESKKDTQVNPDKERVKLEARETAREWVTPMRLTHVLDKLTAAFGCAPTIQDTRDVIAAVAQDVYTEGAGEIEATPELTKEINSLAGKLFRERILKVS